VQTADDYTIDPNHTFPSFSADHFGGLSTWRGKFRRTAGKLSFNAERHTGSVNVVIDTNSIDFGHEKLNEHASSLSDLID
jgi:polyisoprenoid-binding protein YceI